jgi:hypothetical protein
MPITLIDILKQQNRNATSGDFFFMLDSGDINFKVQGIQVDASLSPGTTTDFKYIVEDVSALNAGFGGTAGLVQIMIFLGILVLDLLMRYSWMQAISKMVRLYSMKATQSSMVSTEPHGKN